ncbi:MULTISPECIES: helix-turn-helix domain-containing protein [unclassified Leifsonia]|uniref:IclR family transcriptional regulator n=1 Tax=unclassified Leifsonia TaxID=2663824 RepID=UPI000A1946A6|nr:MULTISPECIES: helix-turn-helix domain-containing protein [unclassified Leifsonia]QIZ99892.1 helix-turn-helix domain-containing protein [Leifsonia sp. PS1209]
MIEQTAAHGDEPRAIALPDSDRGGIQSIERAAMVLDLFDQHTRTLSPALVSERLGLNRTTAHRYLLSLQASGFLSASYGPGRLIDQLSGLVSSRQQILSLAPTMLRQLSDATGLTAVLSFLGRSGAVVAHVEEANAGTIVLTVRVGAALELKAAQTRVLLAFQSDPTVVPRLHAGLDAEEARRENAELALIRRDRIAWADLGRVGLASVAAPVFGDHDIQAAMAVLGTTTMLPASGESAERVAMLREAAEQLGAMVNG